MADTIVANHNTITGSIGVFGMLPYTERLMSDKLGLTFDQVKTTEYADLGSTSRKITDFERQVIQSGVNRIYEDFVNKVGEGRNMTFDEVHEIAQGRVWTGIQAKEIGLVDVLGGIDTSIEIAKKMAGIENYKITEFPRRKSAPWELIFESFQASIKDEVVGVEMMQLKKEFEKITKWVNMETYQVRIPYDIDVN
jgi:protease-4